MLALQAPPNTEVEHSNDGGRKPRRERGIVRPKPIAPYNTETWKAAEGCFDRQTGKSVGANQLLTYRQALAQYHLHPESKFLNGDYLDRGPTRRRHVQAFAINHIGKEANHWEEQYFLGFDTEEQIEYGLEPEDIGKVRRAICQSARQVGQRVLARNAGISRTTLGKLVSGRLVSMTTLRKLRNAI